MNAFTTDIAIVGAGMAGASLAAMIADRAEVLLLEAEAQPGYHATGRSAAFWSESYGGPKVQPLTTASGEWLQAAGMLRPRGCLHIAKHIDDLGALTEELQNGGVPWERLNRHALERIIPGLLPAYAHGVSEPSCQDIDVAALHARFLADARRSGTRLLCDAAVLRVEQEENGWRIETPAGTIVARVLVNAAGAWAGQIAQLAGASPIAIHPYRRTMVQLQVDPVPPATLPLVMDAEGDFYFKPEAGGRLWLSPHDEIPSEPQDAAPEELDQALAIARFEAVVAWRVVRRERAWAGLRSFAPDRLPVYGFDPLAPSFFWFAGQGGFGIQTAPAAAMMGASLLLGAPLPDAIKHIDPATYSPLRFDQPAG